jgi:VanZ family protein
MKTKVRIVIAGMFALFLGAVAYWANTDTMPTALQTLYHFPQGDRVAHFILYGLLAGLLTWALPDRRISKRIPLGPFIAGLGAVAEEASQLFIATRTADWVDLGCGLLGVVCGTLVVLGFRHSEDTTQKAAPKRGPL